MKADDKEIIMATREKGSATLECPTCGATLAAAEQADGALAAVTCKHCHPKTEKAAERANRELGTPVEGSES